MAWHQKTNFKLLRHVNRHPKNYGHFDPFCVLFTRFAWEWAIDKTLLAVIRWNCLTEASKPRVEYYLLAIDITMQPVSVSINFPWRDARS